MNIFNEFISDLYSAAVDVNGWMGFGGRLSEIMEAQKSVIIFPHVKEFMVLSQNGFSNDSDDLYINYYNKIDIWKNAALNNPYFKAFLGQDFVSPKELRSSEFYNDFARPRGMHHVAGFVASIGKDHDQIFGIAVHREVKAKPFDEIHRQRLNELLPHIQRALQIYFHVSHLERRARIGFAALEALPYAALIANQNGTLIFANSMAEKLAHNGGSLLLNRHGTSIGAAEMVEEKLLMKLIYDAANRGTGGIMKLTCKITHSIMLTLVSQVPSPYRDVLLPNNGNALILIKNKMGDSAALQLQFLRDTYGLTEAEAKVARELILGTAVGEIAVQRNVSITTVRTQVRNILEKVGAANIRELISQLSDLSDYA